MIAIIFVSDIQQLTKHESHECMNDTTRERLDEREFCCCHQQGRQNSGVGKQNVHVYRTKC